MTDAVAADRRRANGAASGLARTGCHRPGSGRRREARPIHVPTHPERGRGVLRGSTVVPDLGFELGPVVCPAPTLRAGRDTDPGLVGHRLPTCAGEGPAQDVVRSPDGPWRQLNSTGRECQGVAAVLPPVSGFLRCLYPNIRDGGG